MKRAIYGVLAVLFAGAAFSNLLKGDAANATGGFAIAALLFGYLYFEPRETKAAQDFENFLTAHEEALRRGATCWYQGISLTTNTEITQFSGCFSILLLTQRFSSRFYLVQNAGNGGVGLLYTVFTLLFGWWGIPFGPIYTVQSVYRNLRGGHKTTVNQLLITLAILAAEEAEDRADE